MIAAGKLNRRLTIYAPTTTRSATGAVKASQALVATVWASQDALSLRDATRMSGEAEAAEAKFTIRYRAGIDTNCQVECRGRTYTVMSVEEIGLREGLTLIVRSI